MLFRCPANAVSLDIETAFIDTCSGYKKKRKRRQKISAKNAGICKGSRSRLRGQSQAAAWTLAGSCVKMGGEKNFLDTSHVEEVIELVKRVNPHAIIANRYDECLDDVQERVYTRDIFGRD